MAALRCQVGSRLSLHQHPSTTHPPTRVALILSFGKFPMQKVSTLGNSHSSNPWAGNSAQISTPDPCINLWAKGRAISLSCASCQLLHVRVPRPEDPSRLFFHTYFHCKLLPFQYEIKEKRGDGSRRALAGKKYLTNSNSSPTPL